MIDAQKPSYLALNALVTRLRAGRYVVPDFQREFEWQPSDIQELMRSIFLDYYIGSLLLWEGRTEASFSALACDSLYGFQGDPEPTHIVLDGQQRLTAMYYAFVAPDKPLPKRRNRFFYFIRADLFMTENYDEAFEYDWTAKGKKILDNENIQFERHLFPLKVIGGQKYEFTDWLKGYEKYWEKQEKEREERGDKSGADTARQHAVNAEKFSDHVKEILSEYKISYIELNCDLEIEKVCDIFTRINSQGIPLDIFDLMNAVLKPKGLQLKHMYREVEPRLNFTEKARMNVYILQVMSILLQEYCSPKYLYYLRPGYEKKVRDDTGRPHTEILIKTASEFKGKWDEAVDALDQAIKVLGHHNEFGVIASRYFPYASILPVFASLRNTAGKIVPERRLDAQTKIKDWYWASVFQKRYSSAAETTAAHDYKSVKSWFEDDNVIPKVVADFRKQFRDLDLYAETRRGSSIYIGIFNLLVLRGARDWISGAAPLSDLDDHHIVPQSWGKANKCQTLADSILNRTLLTVVSNREIIRDELPCKYLPRMFKESGEVVVRQILEKHLVSKDAVNILLRDPFTVANFKAFLAERHSTMLDAIEQLCVRAR